MKSFAEHLRSYGKDWVLLVAIVVYAFAGVYRSEAQIEKAGDVLVKLMAVIGIVHGGKKITETIMNGKNGKNGHEAPPDDPTPPSPVRGGGA